MNNRSDVSGLERPGDHEFARRVARVLSNLEAVSDGFETEVMARIRAAATKPARRVGWWTRPLIRLTPVKALALAAGLAGVAYVGGLRSAPSDSQSLTPAHALMPGADTVEIVRFVFFDRRASAVSIVGSFNHWQKEATPLDSGAVPGVWTVSLPLTQGRHEYAFIVDGVRWEVDPFAPSMTDEFGTASSVLRVEVPATS